MKWYEAGGIEKVGRHSLGSGARDMDAGARAEGGGGGIGRAVSDDREAVAWCRKELGVEVSYKKLYDWFRRGGYRKKVPRPMAEKAEPQAQEAWKKGGYCQPCRRRG